MSEQLLRVVLDGPESYEALENAQRHGCQLQLCSVGHEERWQDFPNDVQNDLRAFPPTRYRAVAICAPGGAVAPVAWALAWPGDLKKGTVNTHTVFRTKAIAKAYANEVKSTAVMVVPLYARPAPTGEQP